MKSVPAWGWWLLAMALLAGLFAANARFVQLAFEYRGECIPHASTSDAEGTTHRAAKSSC